MREFQAAVRKDVRLFLSGHGFAALLLPVLLCLALRTFGGELLRPAYIEAFPIGILDEDQTLMSRSLIRQIGEVELFSEVIRGKEGESSERLLEQGCAAVITIPKDFFYTMYRLENQKVSVVLNDKKPLEAALVQSVFTSVMDIIAADQTVGKTVYKFCYGELSKEQEKSLWEETSNYLLTDALGRQNVFENPLEPSRIQEDIQRGLMLCAVSVLCVFFALSAVKTLPEEFYLGILPRYQAAGGRLWVFVLSKFLVSLFLALPSLALLVLIFRPEYPLAIGFAAGIFFAEVFGCLFLLAAVLGEADAIQRAGNLLLLLWLVLGGTLYAREAFPVFVQKISDWTFPGRLRTCMEILEAGTGRQKVLLYLLLSFAAGIGLSGLAVWRLSKKGLSEPFFFRRRQKGEDGQKESAATSGYSLALCRAGKMTLLKAAAMSGGRKGFAALMITVSFCAALAAQALQKGEPVSLRISVAAEKETPAAEELIQLIEKHPGITLVREEKTEGQSSLRSGKTEGLLVIGRGYDEALEGEEGLPLLYESSSSAVSAQAAREVIAGQVLLQKARLRGLRDAERMLGRTLKTEEEEQLRQQMTAEREALPELYELQSRQGGQAEPAETLLEPSQMGFSALVILMTQMTWGVWTGRRDARRVELRMRSLPGGSFLSYGSDAAALWLTGMAAGLCALLPAGWEGNGQLEITAVYALATAGLTLAMTRYTALSGRVDAIAPLTALLTCMAGGCFGDISRFSPFMQKLSFLTPQGLALRAWGGHTEALGYLLLMGMLLLFLGAPGRKNKNCE